MFNEMPLYFYVISASQLKNITKVSEGEKAMCLFSFFSFVFSKNSSISNVSNYIMGNSLLSVKYHLHMSYI